MVEQDRGMVRRWTGKDEDEAEVSKQSYILMWRPRLRHLRHCCPRGNRSLGGFAFGDFRVVERIG
jgi:hypothetical protein